MKANLLTGWAPAEGPPLHPSPQWCRAGSAGFSLVEVTLALGLVTFAAVAILGLLPTGLLVMRQAMDQTVQAQILRSIAGQALVEPFDQLDTSGPFFFDDEGLAVAGEEGSVYTVTISSHTPLYPGSGNATESLDRSLTKLRIEILEQRGGVGSRKTNTHALYVANSGK